MKMPEKKEKHDLLAAILAAKEQGIGAICRIYKMALSKTNRNDGAFTQNSNRRNDVRHYRLVHSLLTFSTSPD